MLPKVEKVLHVEWDDELGHYVEVDPNARAYGCIVTLVTTAVLWSLIIYLIVTLIQYLK